MIARSSSRKFGWCVDLVSDNAPEESEFRVAAESMVGHTGRLVTDHEIDSEGRGTSFRAGDLLFSKLRPYLAKSWVANRDGEALGDIHVYRPVDEMSSRYLGYLLLSSFFLEQVNASTYGTKMPRANWDFIKTIEVWAPDFDTQRRIADYLDRETATIDALIEKQNSLIEALRERRAATVNAILNDVDAPREPLGLSVYMQTGLTLGGAKGSQDGAEVPYLRVANIQTGRIDLGRVTTVRVSAESANRHRLESGDVLMTEGGDKAALGRGALWTAPIDPCLHQNHVFCLRPDPARLLAKYLVWVLEGAEAREYFEKTRRQTTNLSSTNSHTVRHFRFPRPSIDEQREIADHLDRETAKIDALIAKAERFIELAQERRAALITATVTGQIEIPA